MSVSVSTVRVPVFLRTYASVILLIQYGSDAVKFEPLYFDGRFLPSVVRILAEDTAFVFPPQTDVVPFPGTGALLEYDPNR